MSVRPASAIDAAAHKLRKMALACEDGDLLGSEDSLVEKLGVSRSTVRQVARLLEREGFLRVRRGLNGGYFAGRPNLDTVEAAVTAYLDTLETNPNDVTIVASVLWVEAVRRATLAPRDAARAMAARLLPEVSALSPDATFAQAVKLERLTRTEIFALTGARYIELIFQINMAFAQNHYPSTSQPVDDETHRRFVSDWRRGKLMEIEAIADGDPELGMMAARHNRNLWHQRIWGDGPTS